MYQVVEICQSLTRSVGNDTGAVARSGVGDDSGLFSRALTREGSSFLTDKKIPGSMGVRRQLQVAPSPYKISGWTMCRSIPDVTPLGISYAGFR